MVCYCLSSHRGFSFWPFLLTVSTKLFSVFLLTSSPSTSPILPSHFGFSLVGGSEENESFPVESCQILFWHQNEKVEVWNLFQIQLRLQEELVVWLNGLIFISSLLRSHHSFLLIFLTEYLWTMPIFKFSYIVIIIWYHSGFKLKFQFLLIFSFTPSPYPYVSGIILSLLYIPIFPCSYSGLKSSISYSLILCSLFSSPLNCFSTHHFHLNLELKPQCLELKEPQVITHNFWLLCSYYIPYVDSYKLS